MEQEVLVPVPAERLRAALADPAQVARAVPGLQQDAGTEPVAGRLKVRIGGHTITYRGAVRVTPREDGTYAVEGDATEARGSGTVKLALTLRLRETDGGTTLRFEGTASADGRVTELPPETVDSAISRLLNRFAANLGAGAAEETAEAEEGADGGDDVEVIDVIDVQNLDDLDDEDDEDDVEEPLPPTPVFEDLTAPGEPPAEAAHARRTMIGRSAEEVDHAPPRGRYAPVPAPQTVVPNSTLRWAAPAAALVVASAIVVGRALRRRG
ncbi:MULTISPECIES: SRPBCC domain-containing protein [Streptomyces]|jgi:carbon monoxide dehydrogenase subunit G|uniref:SRPBCC domain-containing protein n=1 Tax=Streptomyces sp. 900129855 TaxID=3155129 RepID=A0ABV2ZNC6_9ACTN